MFTGSNIHGIQPRFSSSSHIYFPLAGFTLFDNQAISQSYQFTALKPEILFYPPSVYIVQC